MGNLEISEVGKCRIFGQWSVDGKLDLLGVDAQTVADVDADLERHGGDQPVDLRLEVGAVVDDVDVGVADPGLKTRILLYKKYFYDFYK